MHGQDSNLVARKLNPIFLELKKSKPMSRWKLFHALL